jgi:hypothetical protein
MDGRHGDDHLQRQAWGGEEDRGCGGDYLVVCRDGPRLVEVLHDPSDFGDSAIALPGESQVRVRVRSGRDIQVAGEGVPVAPDEQRPVCRCR